MSGQFGRGLFDRRPSFVGSRQESWRASGATQQLGELSVDATVEPVNDRLTTPEADGVSPGQLLGSAATASEAQITTES